jgi:hypothetical protein
MDKRLISLALCAMLLTLGFPTHARAGEKIPRIGILFIGGRDQPHLESFKKSFR